MTNGARTVVEAPAIELRPVRSAALTRALRDLAAGDFAWIVLTSPATVRMLDERLDGPRDVRAKVAAIGEGTAAAFPRWARRDPDLLPRTFTVEGARPRVPARRGSRALCPRRHRARRPRGRPRREGLEPDRVDAYRTVFPKTLPRAARAALAAGEVDAITFTSASTVRGFTQALGANPVAGKPKVVCIGPVTAAEARRTA